MKHQNKWEKLFDEFLDFIEFGLVKNQNGYFHLKDYTGANLGDIESEEFDNVGWLFERLDRYIYDYIISAIEECLDEIEMKYQYDNWADLLKYCEKLPDSQWDFDIIDMICNHFEEINLENCNYEEEE